MRKTLIVTIIALGCSLTARATDTKELEQALRDGLQGKMLLLRGLPKDKKLVFGSDLKPTSEIHAGPWAGAAFEVEKVQSKKNEIKIMGSCPLIVAPQMGTPRKIEIDIRGPFAPTAQEFIEAIKNKVFVTAPAELDALVPKPWADVFPAKWEWKRMRRWLVFFRMAMRFIDSNPA